MRAEPKGQPEYHCHAKQNLREEREKLKLKNFKRIHRRFAASAFTVRSVLCSRLCLSSLIEACSVLFLKSLLFCLTVTVRLLTSQLCSRKELRWKQSENFCLYEVYFYLPNVWGSFMSGVSQFQCL